MCHVVAFDCVEFRATIFTKSLHAVFIVNRELASKCDFVNRFYGVQPQLPDNAIKIAMMHNS